LRKNTLGKILRTPTCLVDGGLEKGERERTATTIGERKRER
jgi:hypothetical protein